MMDWDWERNKHERDKRSQQSQLQEKEKEKKEEPTDLRTNTTLHPKRGKTKLIPPPLDLSIGATNLSLNHHQTNYHAQTHYLHHPYSPKFSQSEKNLPLRKRWHSWSPILMNQEDLLVPLYQQGDSKQSNNGGSGNESSPPHSSSSILNSPFLSFGSSLLVGSPSPHHPSSASHHYRTSNIFGNGLSHSHTSAMTGLSTPTPFFTPNEPSPKFMNSVFSYYPPPNSPFTNLNLNTPTGPGPNIHNHNHNSSASSTSSSSSASSNAANTATSTAAAGGGNNSGGSSGGIPYFNINMIPSTLLSPAPSQSSNNSLSYEDLHEKSLSFPNPVWSIFLSGTKIRFFTTMNSMDWYPVEFLSQSGDSLGLKGEFAPLGLEIRTLVVTSSPKEKINMTFVPFGDPDHPAIEVNCEAFHPFFVEKKGICSVKPELFMENYGGTSCQQLECGDICVSLNSSTRSPNNQILFSSQNHQNIHSSVLLHQGGGGSLLGGGGGGGGINLISSSNHNSSTASASISSSLNNNNNHIKYEQIRDNVNDESKPILPISVVPTNIQHTHTLSLINSNPIVSSMNMNRKYGHHHHHGPSLATISSAPVSPAKISKHHHNNHHHSNQNGTTKGRRPMNAFLLFAKDKRPELIQMYPGKDNRSISVLLGEAWQTLEKGEKEKYSISAKEKAEEQKRMHPDCWKRKRSQSTSS